MRVAGLTEVIETQAQGPVFLVCADYVKEISCEVPSNFTIHPYSVYANQMPKVKSSIKESLAHYNHAITLYC